MVHINGITLSDAAVRVGLLCLTQPCASVYSRNKYCPTQPCASGCTYVVLLYTVSSHVSCPTWLCASDSTTLIAGHRIVSDWLSMEFQGPYCVLEGSRLAPDGGVFVADAFPNGFLSVVYCLYRCGSMPTNFREDEAHQRWRCVLFRTFGIGSKIV